MVDQDSLIAQIPGYYWGTATPPPPDADTADRVEVKVTYGVEVMEDGQWRWGAAINFPEDWLDVATQIAATWTGAHAPVPVYRRVVEVTRTYYIWGDPMHRVAVEEVHAVLSHHTYTGPADPFEDTELAG